jgi:hypothetical protein
MYGIEKDGIPADPMRNVMQSGPWTTVNLGRLTLMMNYTGSKPDAAGETA